MMPENLLSSPFLSSIAVTLIHFIWQGLLVALVLKLLLMLTPYRKAQTRYGLSSLAMLTNLILPIVTFFVIYNPEYLQVANNAKASPLLTQSSYLEQISSNTWYGEIFEFLPFISMLWASTVSLLAAKLLIELYNVNRLPLIGCKPADSALQARFDVLTKKINLTRNTKLLVSMKTNVPMALGWLKPVVLIPVSMVSGLTPQQLDMLILHELAHIRRHDYLVNFIQTLVEILLFFHPSVRWVSKQMRNEREYCSDDIAVQYGGNPIAYAHTLADTASLCQKHRSHSIPSMAMAASGGDLKQRVIRLVNHEQHCTESNDSGKWLASISILLIVLLTLSKDFLTLPVIDLQSGSISLYNPPLELMKSASNYSPLAIEHKDSKTSLARQLLAIDGYVELTQNEVKEQPAQVTDITESSNAATTIVPAKNEQLFVTTSTQNNTQYNELPIVISDNTLQASDSYSERVLTIEDTAMTTLLTAEKSISDIAFERTDSRHSEATMKNPYSEQVASLLSDSSAVSSSHIEPIKSVEKFVADSPVFDEKETTLKQQIAFDDIIEVPSYRISKTSAQILSSSEPKYPSSAKRKGIEIEVMVEFNIDKSGLVRNIQFESKSKVSYFRNAIRNAMEKWRFLPAKENGKAVESKMSKIFSFSLVK
jgi:TonB family protein